MTSSLESFSLTHVLYTKGDIIGKFLALVMYCSVLMVRRDIQTVFIFVGQLVNVALNLILKKIIKDPRPLQSGLEDEGMPSNHSQFIAFFSTVYICQFLLRCSNLPEIFRYLYSIALLGLAILVCFSRFYLYYHTAEQVVIGALIGCTTALVWHRVLSSTGCRRLAWNTCQHPIARWLCIRNYPDSLYPAMVEYATLTGIRGMDTEEPKKMY